MTSIGFAVSVEHSKHLTAAFNAAGIKAEHLDGKTPSKERSEAAMRLATGETKILWNVDLFGEGYDLSAQAGTEVTVDAVVLARPTKSEALYLQQVGRALRPKADGSKASELCQDFFYHVAVDISQAEVTPGIAVGELLMVEPQ